MNDYVHTMKRTKQLQFIAERKLLHAGESVVCKKGLFRLHLKFWLGWQQPSGREALFFHSFSCIRTHLLSSRRRFRTVERGRNFFLVVIFIEEPESTKARRLNRAHCNVSYTEQKRFVRVRFY